MFASIHQLFNHAGLRRAARRMRLPLFIALVAVWPRFVEADLLASGMLVSLLGALGQLWCFACLEKESVLGIRGPYQLCRNPMYLARYFLLLGFIIAAGSVVAAVIFTVLYYFYMVNRVRREEAVLLPIFAGAYQAYCRDVNRFWPSAKRVDRDLFFFNARMLRHNNGHWNFLSVCAAYAYIYLARAFF